VAGLRPRELIRTALVSGLALAGATFVIAVVEGSLGVPNASAVYILAVAAVALVGGRFAVLVAAVAAFLLYDFLFVQPLLTFTISDPGEWLNLLLILAVGLLVGQMAALLRIRGETAIAREREARALFSVSRELVTRPSTIDVLPRILQILREEANLSRAWIMLDEGGPPRRAADTENGAPIGEPPGQRVLRRRPEPEPSEWVAVHTGLRPKTDRPVGDADVYRVRIEAGGRTLGSLWALRRRSAGLPDPTETRLLAAVADQVGQVLEQDRLASSAREAEIARESDALKSALLDSVSHDMRTPLASIRAAAGSLVDDTVDLSPDDRRSTAEMIDREAEHLSRIVTNLLDLSRVEAGALRLDLEIYDLADLLEPTVDRARRRLARHDLEVAVGDLPPVHVDAVLFDQIVANLLENAARYTAPGTLVRVSAREAPDRVTVRLTVEDAGAGVPEAALPHLFEKFYRAPGRLGGSRGGTGVGLAVVRGLADALGGRAAARRSELGGLAVDVDLPVAAAPPPEPEAADGTEASGSPSQAAGAVPAALDGPAASEPPTGGRS
jgi:two-component system, OmpR family, sensor histidine kinase KdpD